MIKPTLHINGTSRPALFECYVDAMVAVEAAIDTLRKAIPHGRDYYPQGDGAYAEATKEHQERIKALNKIAIELHALAEHCS